MEDCLDEPEASEEGMPLCPHCGEPGDCDHVLVLLDRTYNECFNRDTSGVDSLRYHLEGLLRPYVTEGFLYTGKDKLLAGIVRHAGRNYLPTEDSVDIDLDIFHDWLLEQAASYGARVIDLDDVSGMGYTSKMYVVYAEDVYAVFEKMETYIDEELPDPEEK
ncbi:hypothetical protein SAMN05444008_101351 [Cnuella takakiae]|uniref:Uncharacterized protein n=1 Tax=Cnuella takakiae TaxID=1302690 RepID=A0A1M4T7Q2_9BACT|nr:hypothetical protein [Cnuella takakiae]OLY90689.1 hypothetical protein BUE76_01325 [Cnuella takakiae]SHE40491.1 hypothetical protein SAMN05444008_101351 [Cnuella takakiae]